MQDLTQPEARIQRDALVGRAEVLDRVKALTMLPGDAYATTDLVASYYQVTTDAIEKIAQRHRDEFEADGFRVVTRAEFEADIMSGSSLGQYVRRVAVFPRRAILRVGMLLRDSPIARAVRDALLDAERASQQPVDVAAIDRSTLARWVIEAEDRAKAAEANLAVAAPKAEYVDAFVSPDDLVLFRVLANQLGIGEQALREQLMARKWIYKTLIGRRFSKKQGRLVDEYEYRASADKRAYFRLVPQHKAPRHHNNQLRQTLYVTPQGAVAIRRNFASNVLETV